MTSVVSLKRRDFLKGLAAAAAAGVVPACRPWVAPAPASRLRIGYAAITWGGADLQAMDDIAALGYPGIQLRGSAVARYGSDPAALRRLLAARRLTFVALSSGNVGIDPALEAKTIAEHAAHAAFLRDAGGLYLQLIDERPPNRAVTPTDCERLGAILSEIGRRATAVGVQAVYHPHMGTIGQRPDDAERVLAASDPSGVKLLLDVAHWYQGGGDPAAAIRRHRDRLALLHLKDVEPAAATPGEADGFRFVELGRGRVDLPAVFDAVREIRFDGWGIVELDSVAGGRTPREAAASNKAYLESRGLAV